MFALSRLVARMFSYFRIHSEDVLEVHRKSLELSKLNDQE